MAARPSVVIAEDAMDQLAAYCVAENRTRVMLVADPNTWRVQGEAAEAKLQAVGCQVELALLPDYQPVADALHVYPIFIAANDVERTYIAVGSGTITDIVRFVSHRARCDFISVPTAASVDAYNSISSPMIVNGSKISIHGQAPVAIFGDIRVLTQAPSPMTAAGFGDMLAKFSSVADFRLGHLIWGEPFDETIAQRMTDAVRMCTDHVGAIGRHTAAGLRVLMDALIESGQCMVDYGGSRPASGIEHHYSHYWEMKLMQEGRPPILHGAKTGAATVMAGVVWERIRSLTRADVSDLLEASTLPDREADIATMRQVFGPLFEEVIASQKEFLSLSPKRYDQLKERILDSWDGVQEIAATVPSASELAGWMRAAGGHTNVGELGLSDEDVHLGEQYSHFLRDRFTVRKLLRVLGLHEEQYARE